MTDNIYHLKTSAGEDIICEIVEWNNEEFPELVVRNCYALSSVVIDDDTMSSQMQGRTKGTFYQFRPFMIYQDHPDYTLNLNPDNIVAYAKPDRRVLSQYLKVLAIMEDYEDEEDDPDLEQLTPEQMDNLDRLRQYLTQAISGQTGDSDGNVIHLFKPNKDKMH